MTISSTTRVAGPFSGTGAASTFPFAFKVFSAEDLEVVQLNESSGVLETLDLTSNYSVTLNADQDSSPGGSVTLTAGSLAAGYTLTITTGLLALQGLDLANGGGFYPDVINNALDYLTILIQQLQALQTLYLQFPITDYGESFVLPSATARAGGLMGFDETGAVQIYTNFAGPLLGTVDGINKVFTLTNARAPLTETPSQLTVWLNYPQIPGQGFNCGPEPGQITFTIAPQPGTVGVAADYLYAQGLV